MPALSTLLVAKPPPSDESKPPMPPTNRSNDVALIGALKRQRADFINRLVEASKSKDDDVLDTIRLDSMHQFAEFLYLVQALDLLEINAFTDYIERHNSYLEGLWTDQQKMRRTGLQRDRVKKGIFDARTKPKVLENWRMRPGSIDQSDLGRLLVTVMSGETARKMIVDSCVAAGFMTRQTNVHGHKLVRSLGVLEKAYGDCLHQLRADFAALVPTADQPQKRKAKKAST